ncbi:MAG: ABC transporter ATP-binding protein [Peptococcaceae bacterium]|nr:ABC transporter ATP-binding protein [Peptococcaceae bacterium]
MITVHKVSKIFNTKTVLRNISFHVCTGEIVCLLGPSGAGKTTLLRLITGALKADTGEITIGQTKVPSAKLHSQIGLMPQNHALYTDLTGLENLMFFGNLHGLERTYLAQRAHDTLSKLGLLTDKDKLVQKYSGGMKKRLSLAITLLHNPRYLFLDEPTVGIDPILRQSVWYQLHRLRDSGVSLIVTTHVADEAINCDRIGLLNQGTMVVFDKTENIMKRAPRGNIEDLFFTGSTRIQ